MSQAFLFNISPKNYSYIMNKKLNSCKDIWINEKYCFIAWAYIIYRLLFSS